ncbi:MAG: hypothetical protein ACTSSA_00320 [Candidatus Freyarchaeota archaeon]
MQPRGIGIVLVVFGLLVGVSVLWNWPFKVAVVGGGPAVLVYFILLLVVGVPVVLIELALGSRSGSGFPKSLGAINPRLEFFGWFAAVNAFWLVVWLCSILSWSACFAYYSLTGFYPFSNWLYPLSGSFNFVNYFFNYGSSLLPLAGLIIVWGSVSLLLLKTSWGSKIRALAIRVVFPALAVVLFAIFVLAVALPGGLNPGLNFYLGFDPSAFLSGSSWRTMTTLLLFNLGAGLGVLGFYAGRIPESRSRLVSSSILAPLLGVGLIFLGGLAFFTMSGASGLVDSLGSSLFPLGPLGLPAAPFIGWSAGFAVIERCMGPLVGKGLAFLFYTLIAAAGIVGLTLMVEPITETLKTKFRLGERKFLVAFIALGFLTSVPFTLTSSFPLGFYLMSLANWWVEGFGLTLVVLVELVAAGWIWGAENIVGYVNSGSRLKVPKWFGWIIKFVAPGALILVLALGVYDTLSGYVLYSWGFLYPLTLSWLMSGWFTNLNNVFLLLLLVWLVSNLTVALVLTRKKPVEKG